MDRLINESCDPKQMSTAALAFAGDAVYSLLVREKLCCSNISKADKLHKTSVEMVRCQYQAAAMERLMPVLTEAEKAVYMRGRNAHTSHVPKNSEVADYRAATGFEALMGYVYLCGNIERLRELFAIIISDKEGDDDNEQKHDL